MNQADTSMPPSALGTAADAHRVGLQHHEDSQCRNLPCGYIPRGETINANGKESHNGRQRWEKG